MSAPDGGLRAEVARLRAEVDALTRGFGFLCEEVAVLALADGPPVPKAEDYPDLAPGWVAPVIALRAGGQR